ncbi:hypothetical protein [Rhizobium sp. BK538]|uniref:hypothetical protein n=1 Tax=Rhizobium sp. BK538 TaxID=2586984 RepID=UPI001611E8BC|nr:hypothetical protein [Rhizobium sp. BK538]MBB4170429.1 hypothetical protein [Rhizobium sp. BK538]
MRSVLTIAAITTLVCSVSIANAGSAGVFLFIDAGTVETKIEGLDVRLRGELTDKDLTERDFMRRPRFRISCQDGGRQFLFIDTADDLDPWPDFKSDAAMDADAKLVSQTGAFEPLATRLRAYRVNDLLTLAVDITGRATEIVQTWAQGFPIKLTSSPGNALSNLNLVVFPGENNARFRTEISVAAKACALLSGS